MNTVHFVQFRWTVCVIFTIIYRAVAALYLCSFREVEMYQNITAILL